MDFKRQTYSTQVGQFIRNLIQSSTLKPGDPIREVELAKELGISRAPIREALQVLVQDGLITSEPQKGKTVRVLNADEVKNGYHISGILEGAGIAQSIDLWTKEDMEELRKIVDLIGIECEKEGNLDYLSRLDDDFHNTLLKHCKNDQLINLARITSSNISKFLCYHDWVDAFTPQTFYQKHQKIAEVIFSKDKAEIEKTIRQHYQETAVTIASAILARDGA